MNHEENGLFRGRDDEKIIAIFQQTLGLNADLIATLQREQGPELLPSLCKEIITVMEKTSQRDPALAERFESFREQNEWLIYKLERKEARSATSYVDDRGASRGFSRFFSFYRDQLEKFAKEIQAFASDAQITIAQEFDHHREAKKHAPNRQAIAEFTDHEQEEAANIFLARAKACFCAGLNIPPPDDIGFRELFHLYQQASGLQNNELARLLKPLMPKGDAGISEESLKQFIVVTRNDPISELMRRGETQFDRIETCGKVIHDFGFHERILPRYFWKKLLTDNGLMAPGDQLKLNDMVETLKEHFSPAEWQRIRNVTAHELTKYPLFADPRDAAAEVGALLTPNQFSRRHWAFVTQAFADAVHVAIRCPYVQPLMENMAERYNKSLDASQQEAARPAAPKPEQMHGAELTVTDNFTWRVEEVPVKKSGQLLNDQLVVRLCIGENTEALATRHIRIPDDAKRERFRQALPGMIQAAYDAGLNATPGNHRNSDQAVGHTIMKKFGDELTRFRAQNNLQLNGMTVS